MGSNEEIRIHQQRKKVKGREGCETKSQCHHAGV